MGSRRISDDLKEAALCLERRGRDSTSEILKIAGFSRSTLYRTRRRKDLTGSVAKTRANERGRPRTLVEQDSDYIVRPAKHKPTLFLAEYRGRLDQYRNLPASLSTLHRTFRRTRTSLKQVQKMAFERSAIKRAGYSGRISIYPADYLIFIDETSKYERTYAYIFGRSEIGTRVECSQPFVRKRPSHGGSSIGAREGDDW
jgi:transposase